MAELTTEQARRAIALAFVRELFPHASENVTKWLAEYIIDGDA